MLRKITNEQMNSNGVISAPNVLNGSAADNKRVFDKLIRQVVSVLFNQLVDALTATTGAKEIGAVVPTVTTKTVQAILSAFDTAITDRYTKAEVNSLTNQETTNLVENVDVNLTTGVMTITKKDGTVTQFDTALEKVPATFELKDIGGVPTLLVTNVDGSTSQMSVDALVDTYTFKDSAEIDFQVTGSNNTKTITAVIRPSSIDESKLSLSATTYLQGLKTAASDSASAAAESETNAANSATTSKGWAQGGTNTHPDEEQNNSKYWSEQAADSAEAAGSAAIAAGEYEGSTEASKTAAAKSESEAKTSETNTERLKTSASNSASAAAQSEANAKASEASSKQFSLKSEQAVRHYPYINPDTQTWFTWNPQTQSFEDTGASVIGPRGVQGVQGIQGTKGEQGLRGEKGPQGVRGEKGEKGDNGRNAVTVETSGLFCFTVEDDGNLYVSYSDDSEPPNFQINDAGELVYTM